MKKLLFIVGILLVLAACSNKTANETDTNDETDTFEGTIQSIEGDRALLDARINDVVEETPMAIYITLPSDDFAVGDVVIVEYNGMILESDPAQVQAISVKRK